MERRELVSLGLTDAVLASEAERLLPGVKVDRAILKEDSGRALVYRQSLFDRVTYEWHNGETG